MYQSVIVGFRFHFVQHYSPLVILPVISEVIRVGRRLRQSSARQSLGPEQLLVPLVIGNPPFYQ